MCDELSATPDVALSDFESQLVIGREEAKALGLKHYFSGKPCLKGHIAKRFVSTRSCVSCQHAAIKRWRKENTEESQQLNRSYYEANREKHLERNKRRYEENRDKYLDRCREWYSANREKRLESSRAYYEENREKRLSKCREWYSKNTERARENGKRWDAANPEKKSSHKHNRRARLAGTGGKHTSADIAEILKMQKNRCAYCRVKLKGKYEIDHITPVSAGGRNDRTNLQATCSFCNRSKGAIEPLKYARQVGLLL